MWLVLASKFDDSALWAATRLRARLSPLRVLSPELLLHGARWVHRLGADGVETTITLADGTVIDGGALRGVLNRLVVLQPELFAAASAEDRLYAIQETQALLTSVLASLSCPVLNRPGSRGLNGPWCVPCEWAALALRAGLAVVPRRSEEDRIAASPPSSAEQGPTATVFVVGDRCLVPSSEPRPNVLEELFPGSLALTRKLRLTLLGLDFTFSAEGAPLLASVTTLPDLRRGGGRLIDALAEALTSEGEAGSAKSGRNASRVSAALSQRNPA